MNIDAGDESNPQLVSEYVNDIYAYLLHLETIHTIGKNHLEGQREVFPKMRAVLIDWINEVHLQYHFVQETFHMAVSIIDRYLQVNDNVIAAETPPPFLTIFISMCEKNLNKKQK